MSSIGAFLKERLDETYQKLGRPISIAETGCLRSIDPPAEDSDGWSSPHIAQWVAEHKGCEFYVIDIDPDNLIKAGRIMGERGLEVRDHFIYFQAGESVVKLKELDSLDFAYLDSSSDLEHGLAEFKVAEKKGCVMITMDDRVEKCLLAIDYARASGRWDINESGRTVVFRRK